MNKEWIRDMVEKDITAIYGLKNPSEKQIEEMVEGTFSQCPTVQFPGFQELHPLFGIRQGIYLAIDHYKSFYNTVEVLALEKQYIIVDGFNADAHYRMELKFKESGSVYDFELLFLTDIDELGKVRDIKLYFDTATFLKAVKTKNGHFTDVREALPHPDFDPASPVKAGAVASNVYMAFARAYYFGGDWEDFYNTMEDGVEVIFKSNVDVLPYAGQYSNREGFKQWIADLTSLWSLNAFNFTKVYTEGNAADFMMHELHYYNNPDGSKRYLDVYIVQSFKVSENGRIEYFKSYNDSAWLDETLFATEVYKKHYGYPDDYPKGMK